MDKELLITMIFTTINSIVVVYLTEFLVNKREKKKSQNEMKQKYLSEHTLWLNSLYSKIMLFSRKLEDCLNKENLNDREIRLNQVWEMYNLIVEEILSYSDAHTYIDQFIESDNNLADFRMAINEKLRILFNLLNEYLYKPKTNKSLEINNQTCADIKKLFDLRYSLINNEINKFVGCK